MTSSFRHPENVGRAWAASLMLLATSLLLAGCQTGSVLRSATPLPERVDPARVVLIEPDVELAEFTAGGLMEVKADWTATGREHVNRALDDFMRERATTLHRQEPPAEGTPQYEAFQQLLKLHRAVGVTILQHKYAPALALPSKGERFDWTLAGAVEPLRVSGTDYGLFVHLHDSYASAGRVGVIVLAAMFGVAVPGGVQVGFASLVDLRSGDIVWFNRLVSTTGDLREANTARKAVDALLTEFPL